MSVFVYHVLVNRDKTRGYIKSETKICRTNHVDCIWIKLDKARFINCLRNSQSGRLESCSLIAPFASANSLIRHCFLYQAPTANAIDREWEHRQLATIVSIGVNMIIVRSAISLLRGRIFDGFYWTISCFDASARWRSNLSCKIYIAKYITLLHKRQMAVKEYY